MEDFEIAQKDIIEMEIELLTLEDITAKLETLEYDEEVKKTNELVEFSTELIPVLGTKVNARLVEIVEFSAISLLVTVPEGTFHVHPSWVANFSDSKSTLASSFLQNKRNLKLSAELMVNLDTKELISLKDLAVCSECGEPLDIHGLDICSSCLTEKHYNVKSHSFTPSYIHYGEQEGKLETTNNAWYGLELEYGLPRKVDMAKLVYASEGPEGNKALFLKSDSSITGGEYRAEMVTHPMSFDYLMSAEWLNNLSSLQAVDRPESNGCHIHISRTAFKTDKAFNKFKYLLLSNKKALEAIGGRPETSYAKFKADDSERTSTKDRIVGEKYNAINQTHTHTIECRFMASTDNPVQVRRYIQFLDSMVKYTSYHSSTASFEEYVRYVAKYKDKYAIIHQFILDNEEVFKVGQVTIKSYVKKVIPIEILKVSDFMSVTKIIFTNNETKEKREVTTFPSDRRIRYRDRSESIEEIFGNYCESTETITVEIIG